MNPQTDLNVLRHKFHQEIPSRLMEVGAAQIPPSQLAVSLTRLSASYREFATPSPAKECPELALAVEQRIRIAPERALEIVELEVVANPSCACEIVKAAIQAGGGDSTMVLAVVEASINAAPEHMRLIAQCAVAVSPDSSTGIHSLLARLDPNGGDSSATVSAKGEVTPIRKDFSPAVSPNPLDLPRLHVIAPLPILPHLVTHVDP